MANEVFISYSHRDLEKVKQVKEEIDREVGIDCWMTLDRIETENQFERVNMETIKRHDTVLFMQTATSMESKWTQKELQFAESQGKYIVLIDLDHAPLLPFFDYYSDEYKTIDWDDKFRRNWLLKSMKRWFGKIEIEPDDLFPYSGLYGREGYVDDFGRFILPCKWHHAYCFTEGLAMVESDGDTFGFIDKTGRLIGPCEWIAARDFSEGLAAVGKEECGWGFIDKTGHLVIPCQWKYADNFSKGLAKVADDNLDVYYIDKTGRVVK